MTLRIVVPGAWGEMLEPLLAFPATVVKASGSADADLIPLLADADAVLLGRFSRALAEAAPKLRLIQTPGAGTDAIDFSAIPPGVTLCNVYGHERGMAEYAMMTMMALVRDLFGMDRRLRQGDWGPRGPATELYGKTLVVVGVGHIGAEVARYARFFGMRVLGVTRSPDSPRAQQAGLDAVYGSAELERALGEADFVVIAVPLEPATRGLIGARQLQAMKRTAYIVNIARGPIIDEQELYDALKDRAIAGAAIDVWYRYTPDHAHGLPANLPFHELDNIIMTPHMSGWTDGTVANRWPAIAENFRRLATGEPLMNVVVAGEAARGLSSG